MLIPNGKSAHSVFVNSGSSANLLIIQSAKEIYNWNNADEVIVPSLTWTTTVTPVIQAGLKPVFVDCNLNDFSFNYEDLKKKLQKKQKQFLLLILLVSKNIALIKNN